MTRLVGESKLKDTAPRKRFEREHELLAGDPLDPGGVDASVGAGRHVRISTAMSENLFNWASLVRKSVHRCSTEAAR
jgi:hypothetical protein